jgi:hypothetical protein
VKFLPYLIYTIIFITIWGLRPPISSDSFHGLSDRPLNIVKSLKPLKYQSEHSFNEKNQKLGLIRQDSSPVLFYKTQKTIYPLMLENKHSGLTILPYKFMSMMFSSKVTFFIWHFVGGLLVLYLVQRLLKKIYSEEISHLFGVILSFSPLLIFLYVFFISEILGLVFFLLILERLENQNKRDDIIVGVLVALGLYVRVNFLWLALAIIPFIGKRYWAYLRIAVTGLIASIPHLFLVDWTMFFKRAADYQMDFSLYNNSMYFLYSFLGSWKSFIYLWDETYQVKLLSPMRVFGTDVIASIMFVLLVVGYRKAKSYERFKKNLISFFIFVIALFASIKLKADYTNYFYPVVIFQILIFSDLAFQLKNKKFSLVIGLCFMINSVFVYFNVLSKDLVSRHNLRVTERTIEEISKRKLTFYTLGESDVGRYEYLSNSQTQPIHLYSLINEKKLRTLFDVLEQTESGVIATPLRDEWSSWYWNWGEMDPTRVKQVAAKLGIKISNEVFIKKASGENAIWIFDYRKEIL